MRGVSILALALVTFVCLSEANNDGPHWSQWEVFGKSCKLKCDKGNERWKRRCINGKTSQCGGKKFKFHTCVDLPPCATWGSWVPFKKCSAKCGDGEQKYKRKCNRLKPGRKCPGGKEAKFKTGTCNNGQCAAWSAWTAGECSVSCGAGTFKETRECQAGIGRCDGKREGAVQEQSKECNKGACAEWGAWKDGACSVTCGQGTIKSTRECQGLGDCDGVGEKSTVCNKRACSVEIKKTTTSAQHGGTGEKGRDALYLDRHHVYCNVGEALSEFKLQKTSTTTMQYKYSCWTNAGQSGSVAKQTAFDTDGITGNGVMESFYLDRHNVDCGYKGILSSFRLQRNAAPYGKIRYEYVCNTYANDLTCNDKQTPWNAADKGHVLFLDRHHPYCENGSAISRFRLERSGDTIRYNYRCCQY